MGEFLSRSWIWLTLIVTLTRHLKPNRLNIMNREKIRRTHDKRIFNQEQLEKNQGNQSRNTGRIRLYREPRHDIVSRERAMNQRPPERSGGRCKSRDPRKKQKKAPAANAGLLSAQAHPGINLAQSVVFTRPQS